MPRPRRAAALALSAAVALAGCGGGGGRPAAAPATVEISLYAFAPASVTVARGQAVTWVERDEDVAGKGAHSIVLDDGSYDSGLVARGESVTFTPAASATYHCGVHNYMRGAITVR